MMLDTIETPAVHRQGIKLSDYVARFIAAQGVRQVFVVAGGASVHLIQSIWDTEGLTFICPQHEQAGAMAADAYARVTGNIGVAVSTSGPGATNLLTGVACAYYDSVPVVYITGQVSTFRARGNSGVRQIGFQETDTIELFNPVTKYATRIDDASRIRYELEKACFLAKEGRPGPVLIDIPDDIQRAMINPTSLPSYSQPAKNTVDCVQDEDIDRLIELIEKAKRPVLIIGWGIHLSRSEEIARTLIDEIGFPVAPTWGAADILPSTHPLNVGTFGTHGTRHGNFAVQNADLILSIGSRLDTKATGSPPSTFARGASKVVVDIDEHELKKFAKYGLSVDLLIRADVRDFIQQVGPQLGKARKFNIIPWLEKIRDWKNKYPVCKPSYALEMGINPYVFVQTLSNLSSSNDTVVVDTGCAIAWMMQCFEFKSGQRLYHDWNNTAMGWALPASIAACLALDKKPITLVIGDGSLLMNLQELATVVRHALPIKILLINNSGYSMIRQTQDQWLNSSYLASSIDGGLPKLNFVKIAESFGIDSFSISLNSDLKRGLERVFTTSGAVLCNVTIGEHHRVSPQVKYGRPNEDPDPLLPRKEFLENMLIEPLEVSQRMNQRS
jgi:acetolactate synthase-1/2/3 large subunit